MSDENQNPEQSIQDQANQVQDTVNNAQNQAQDAGNSGQNQDNDILEGVRQQVGGQVDQAIDQLGNKIPGGSQFTDPAKKTAGGFLDNLKQEAEKRLGGLFGGHKES